jgi:PAS domain S-box-containing protein
MLSIYIFAVQICLFGAIALYLHYRSEDYGFTPLLFFVAGIMGVFNVIELMTLFIEPAPGIIIRPGGHVFVPIILLTVLVVYITSGTRSAQVVIAGLIGVDVLVLSILVFLLLYLNVRTPSTVVQGLLAEEGIVTPLFLRGVVASTIAFTADMFVIAIVYQGIVNAFPSFSRPLIPGIALLIALWVDAVLYNFLGFFGTPRFVSGIPGDILMKTLAGLLLSPLACWYLARIAPRLTNYLGATNRSTLDILFGEGEFASRLAQLESELQVSRAIYEQIIQHIGEIFWLVDIKQERLLYLSPNFEKLTGQAPERFYRHPGALLKLVHPDDRAQDISSQVFLSPESEFRIRREDGSFRWFRNRSFPIITQDQQVVRYAGIVEDITARREAQAQAFALELSREKVNLLHRFIRDASHDLRTPLSTILLRAHLLEKVDADRRKVVIGEIREAAQRLNKLIDDMFTLSRIESEEQIEMASVDLNEIVQQVCGDHKIIAQTRNLCLAPHLMNEAIPVTGNPDQLSRLVANLVDNAIHYTEQGTITVATLTRKNQAILEIRDTGIGIPEAHLESIFERFYRTAQAREMRRDGTGLGLAISKAIVEQHRGTITVQSVVGEGTTFQVAFPIDRAHQDQAQQE